MAPLVSITEAELYAALAAAAPGRGPSEAKTVMEIADEIGQNERTVRRSLSKLKAAGRLVRHAIKREGLDGRTCSVSGYTIVPLPAKAKR